MKKATFVFFLLGVLFFGAASGAKYLADRHRFDIVQPRYVTNYFNEDMMRVINREENGALYFYTQLGLSQNRMVSECVQAYLADEQVDEAGDCREEVVDIVLNKIGEVNMCDAILGDMMDFVNDTVYFQPNYIRNLLSLAPEDKNLKNMLIRTFINRYRNPNLMREFFEQNKEPFLNHIPASIYAKTYGILVESLLHSYEEIYSADDVEAYFQKVYSEAEAQQDQGKYWRYTFWKRREAENNDLVLYHILKEIREYYAATDSP